MMKYTALLLSFLVLLTSCGDDDNNTLVSQETPAIISNGNTITFSDTKIIAFFKTKAVSIKNINAEITAPGKIVANVLPSGIGASQNMILFDNPELSSEYTQLIQHQININHIANIVIKQKKLELERTQELFSHGSATGQEVMAAESELSMAKVSLENEQTALIEHEINLQSGGFNPKSLQNAKAGTAYLICELPENQISKITPGQTSKAVFSSFPNETISGKVDAIAEIVDNTTRMVKVRILIDNHSRKLKTGMFANVSFELTEGDFISILETALVTIQGKHYVFVKASPNEFERRELQIGQQMGDRIIVFGGLKSDEEIAVEGVMQLKGLSFGY